ncbi:hypothetical protein [Stigmatella erecta]|uniref:Uncharacterized protein n=1 Tax=Stigmatella erecta TaxID=83460 RepID=A0A1I0L6W1_9BACT|nr:hypothetical protein [Stigmatella erecta]SEU35446.1 hypothetical protein SAMN05443639_12070 [Stigmatella erecta]
MRSSEEWSRLGGGLIVVLALGTVLAVMAPRVLGLAAGPEVEIITALKRTEADGLSVMLPGVSTPLTGRTHRFARITVRLEPGGQRAEALATLDFNGKLGKTEISSLGVERVPFVQKDGVWAPEGSAAPRLAAVVAALEFRRRALEAGDTSALNRLVGRDAGVEGTQLDAVLALGRRRYQSQAWYIRMERDEAVVTERWRLEGVLPSRPVDEQGERSLSLLRDGDEFFFSPTLM